MTPHRQRLLLLLLLAVWMLIAWPHLSEQFSNAEQVRAALADLSWEERAAAIDQPAYAIARDIGRIVPERGCVQVVAYTGPEHLRYYQARLAYYLYPRRLRLSTRTDENAGGCDYLAVFRDSRQNLAVEPFHGHWNEAQLAARTAAMTKLLSTDQLQIFQSRP